MQDLPVYLFTGFLDAGKTRFIQETLEDERFHKGERTLLLLCEEGEEEYDPERFCAPNVFQRVIEDESDFTPENLSRMQREVMPERVIIEYNGMWPMQTLYDNIPACGCSIRSTRICPRAGSWRRSSCLPTRRRS